MFTTCSSSHKQGVKHKGYRGEVDMFGVYCPEIDQTYLVPVDAVGEKGGSLRLEPPKNNQSKGVNFAADYVV